MKNLLPMLMAISVLAGVPAFIMSAKAHHSYAMFDSRRTVRFEATVLRFRWQNPHAFIDAEMIVNGKKERWAIEMTSPNNLIQSGWTRRTLRVGEKVVLYVHPLRNGARGGAYSGVELADGTTLGKVG